MQQDEEEIEIDDAKEEEQKPNYNEIFTAINVLMKRATDSFQMKALSTLLEQTILESTANRKQKTITDYFHTQNNEIQ